MNSHTGEIVKKLPFLNFGAWTSVQESYGDGHHLRD
jgi:hypothetical protein